MPEATKAEVDRLIETSDSLAAEVGASAPWDHPRAAEFDRVSFRGWLEPDPTTAHEKNGVAADVRKGRGA